MADALPSFRRWAFLDRDGTIILDKIYLSDPAGVEFAPGAVEGLKLLRDAGFGFVMITNQSGIGRGYFTEADFAAVQARLAALLAGEELALAATYHCPHAPEDRCDCRKPKPAMLVEAMRRFAITPENVVMIGDGDADTGAAEAAGIRAIRISPDGRGNGTDGAVTDFLSAARLAVALVPPADAGPDR